MPQIQTTTGEQTVLRTGADLYDALMRDIEPELLRANIDHLDEKYTSETPEERTARYERYTKAYAAYDIAYADFMKRFAVSVHDYKKQAFRSAEVQNKTKENEALHALEEQFS